MEQWFYHMYTTKNDVEFWFSAHARLLLSQYNQGELYRIVCVKIITNYKRGGKKQLFHLHCTGIVVLKGI